jgi:hypothetical protein
LGGKIRDEFVVFSRQDYRAPVLILAFCVSLIYTVRSPETFAIFFSALSKILQPYELSMHFDLGLFLRSQIELIQNLSAQAFSRSDWTAFEFRPSPFSGGMKPRLMLMVAATDISVIIPSLNEEKYLQKCLSSLVNQHTKESYEIIVVDGGSNDKTIDIAKKYADKVIVEPRRPVGAARNAGAWAADGEILAFIDADTVASNSWIDAVENALEPNGIVGVTGPTLPYDGRLLDTITYKAWTLYLQRMLLSARMPHVIGFNCAYRRNAFFQVGGFDEKCVMSEDIRLALKMRQFGKIIFDPRMSATTSARRFRKYGRAYLTALYLANGVSTLLLNKSSHSYPPVR